MAENPLANPQDIDNPLQRYVIDEDMEYIQNIGQKSKSKMITVNVKCVYPDPQRPGELIPKIGSLTVDMNKPVQKISADFLNTYPEVPQNKTYFVGYDQLLFREGTVAECGISHGKSVELIAPGKNAASYHNEGLKMIVFALIPLIFGLAAIIFSMTTGNNVPSEDQALFLFLGLIFTIPSVVVIAIGLVLIPQCPMPCYFNGQEWC